MNSKQAKSIPLQDYLAMQGHQPAYQKRDGLWYRSPFREERTPSFRVNPEFNSWIDFGIGDEENMGGNIIDFTIIKHNLSKSDISKALEIIEDIAGRVNQIQLTDYNTQSQKIKDTSQEYEITEVRALRFPPLLNYITDERKIPARIAKKYCKEIFYKSENKKFFAICFENDSGGYETRNKILSRSFTPKDITTIKGQSDDLIILFEGFIDFLSYLTYYGIDELKYTCIILNSAHMKQRAIDKINKLNPKSLHFCLDNDNTGFKTKDYIIEQTGLSAKSHHTLYEGYNDFNAFLQAVKLGKHPIIGE